MKVRPCLIVAALALLFIAYQSQGAPGEHAIKTSVQAVLDEQVKDWNEGSIERFMRGYHRAETTRFASGGDISRGWQTVFERYKKKYADKAAMGKLTFSDLETTVLSADAALVFGRWRLEREKDEPSGLFTLLFRKTPEGWRIVHDHTSAAAKN
jgi:ketosteroid isomerase-like protein